MATPHAALAPDAIEEMRRLHRDEHVSAGELMKRFGISRRSVFRALARPAPVRVEIGEWWAMFTLGARGAPVRVTPWRTDGPTSALMVAGPWHGERMPGVSADLLHVEGQTGCYRRFMREPLIYIWQAVAP